MKHLRFASAAVAALLLAGCGGSDDTTTATTATSVSGYFVDAPVANLNYDCLADGTSGVTDANGAFMCQNGTQVRFRAGELVLGEITSVPADSYVFPQDLVGVSRDNTTDPRVTAIAQLLQSLDTDGDPSNGIVLETTETDALPATTFDPQNLHTYLNAAAVSQNRIRTETEAREHLRLTLQTMSQTATTTSTTTTTTAEPVTQEVLDTIRYMDNEERLAYDLYMALYGYHASMGTELMQLVNIAQNSESQHIASVENLATSYGLEPASSLPSGQYDVPEVQNLYDALYAKGVQSAQDALEVGCMVEVTDINDLDHDIAIAQAAGATDVVTTFEFLRNGSYNHYWAFDKGLKNMGVTEGCCSLGSEWCHPEYPQNEKGGGNRSDGGNGNGQRQHLNR